MKHKHFSAGQTVYRLVLRELEIVEHKVTKVIIVPEDDPEDDQTKSGFGRLFDVFLDSGKTLYIYENETKSEKVYSTYDEACKDLLKHIDHEIEIASKRLKFLEDGKKRHVKVTMTKKELVEELEKFDDDDVVICIDEQGNWDNIKNLEKDGDTIEIIRDTSRSPYE